MNYYVIICDGEVIAAREYLNDDLAGAACWSVGRKKKKTVSCYKLLEHHEYVPENNHKKQPKEKKESL